MRWETSTSGPLTIVVSTLAFTTTSPLPSGTINVPYVGVQFAASRRRHALSAFTLASGAVLPPGLMFSAGGPYRHADYAGHLHSRRDGDR